MAEGVLAAREATRAKTALAGVKIMSEGRVGRQRSDSMVDTA